MTSGYISVLTCTRNRGSAAARCVKSLSLQDYPASLLEIAVLDDASTDGSPAQLREALAGLSSSGWSRTQLFISPENMQIAAGRSFLEQKVSPEAEFVCFVDDDAELPAEIFSELAGYLMKNPGAGAVGPRISAMRSPEVAVHKANFVDWSGRYTDNESLSPLDCDWLNSTCLMVRVSALRQAGGFYPGFYTAHEEVDFCLRLKAHGWKVVYLPGINVLHDVIPGGTKRDRLYYLYRNKFLVFRRNFGPLRFAAASLGALLFGLPKYILESAFSGSGSSEYGLILTAVFHGLLGREGKGPV